MCKEQIFTKDEHSRIDRFLHNMESKYGPNKDRFAEVYVKFLLHEFKRRELAEKTVDSCPLLKD